MIVNQIPLLKKYCKKHGAVRPFSEEELTHYREPFRKPEYRKPLWRWPNKIPIEGRPKNKVKVIGE